MKWKSVACGTLLVLFGVAASAHAAAIVGTFNFANAVTVKGVDGPDADPFNNQYTADFFPPGTGSGVEDTTNPATGYFAALFPPSTNLQNLDFTDAVVAGFTTIPSGVAVLVPNFLSNFVAMPGLAFDLTMLFQGGAPLCTGLEAVNQSCSPTADSPFVLKRTNSGVEVDFGVAGNFRNGADSGAGFGSYTTQLTGSTIAGVLGTLAAGGQIEASFSANYVSQAVPEPASLLTFGIGCGALALLRRRQRAAQKA